MEWDFLNAGVEEQDLMSMLQVSACKNLLDEHFTLVQANESYYNLIGYTREEYETLYPVWCASKASAMIFCILFHSGSSSA